MRKRFVAQLIAVFAGSIVLPACRGDSPQIAAVPEPTTSALVPGAPNAESAGAEPVPHSVPGAKPTGKPPLGAPNPKDPLAPPPNMKGPPPTSTSL